MRPLRWSLGSITVLRRGPGHSGIPEVPSGSKYQHISPPRGLSISSEMESIVLGPTFPEQKGEATYTIPEECERLFCDSLSAIFLGERSDARRESLGIDAGQIARNCVPHGRARVEKWFEVLDYTSDLIYRGFVTDMSGDRTLFVFFGDGTLGHGLKTGLIALFELAAIPNFDCARIVACVPRSQDASETEIVRNLGWCGFNLTTLQPWSTGVSPLSTKWLFLDAEV